MTDAIERGLRRWQRRTANAVSAPRGPIEQTARWSDSRMVVAVFYAATMYLSIASLKRFRTFESPDGFDPLWPARWMTWVEPMSAFIALHLAVIAACGAILWRPGPRWPRIVVCLATLCVMGADAGFGKINHGFHMWWWVSFFLVFLPRRWADAGDPGSRHDRIVRQQTLTTLWSARAAVLLFYSCAGLMKLRGVLSQTLSGEPSHFSVGGLSSLIATRHFKTGTSGPLAEMLVRHEWLATPGHVAAVGLEFAAVFSLLYAGASRWVAIGLIGMHVGIGLVMDIWFVLNPLLLLILFVLPETLRSLDRTSRRRSSLGFGSSPRATADGIPSTGPAV